MEHGINVQTIEGAPQGAGISPLLANSFPHYALDRWVRQCQRRYATGRMRMVRYGDDFVMTFERGHAPVGKQEGWLNSVLRGHYAYYGITGNRRSINRFRSEVVRTWRYVLMRRGQRSRMYRGRCNALLERFPLAPARIVHV